MSLFSQANRMTKSFTIMGKISSYGKNPHSLFLYLWASARVLVASGAHPQPKGVWSPPGCPSHTAVPGGGGPGGMPCLLSRVPSDLYMTCSRFLRLVGETCLEVRGCFLEPVPMYGSPSPVHGGCFGLVSLCGVFKCKH